MLGSKCKCITCFFEKKQANSSPTLSLHRQWLIFLIFWFPRILHNFKDNLSFFFLFLLEPITKFIQRDGRTNDTLLAVKIDWGKIVLIKSDSKIQFSCWYTKSLIFSKINRKEKNTMLKPSLMDRQGYTRFFS